MIDAPASAAIQASLIWVSSCKRGLDIGKRVPDGSVLSIDTNLVLPAVERFATWVHVPRFNRSAIHCKVMVVSHGWNTDETRQQGKGAKDGAQRERLEDYLRFSFAIQFAIASSPSASGSVESLLASPRAA